MDHLATLLAALPFDWLLQERCPFCRRSGAGADGSGERPCLSCRSDLALGDAPQGRCGQAPLPWWAAGAYAEGLRGELLRLRRHPRPEPVAALVRELAAALPAWSTPPLLVPLPSWKRRANPLPPLLSAQACRLLGVRQEALLARSRPVLGQHHLNRRQRIANQAGAFRCLRSPRSAEARRRPLLLVDDILTTGATACSAARALEAEGWRVLGLLCLARTPVSRRSDAVPSRSAAAREPQSAPGGRPQAVF